jgi:hypothetical protein
MDCCETLTVGKFTDCKLNNKDSILDSGKDFPFATECRQFLGHNVPGTLTPGVKRPELEADQSP